MLINKVEFCQKVVLLLVRSGSDVLFLLWNTHFF